MLKHSMVGYLESCGSVSIEEAIAHNYNVLVIAFGTIDGKRVGMNLNCGPSFHFPMLYRQYCRNRAPKTHY